MRISELRALAKTRGLNNVEVMKINFGNEPTGSYYLHSGNWRFIAENLELNEDQPITIYARRRDVGMAALAAAIKAMPKVKW